MLWFVAALLLFTAGYALYRRWGPELDLSRLPNVPTYRMALLFTLLIAAMTFLVRLVFPLGLFIPWVGFQPGSFPQYICMFIVGLIAYRCNRFQQLPISLGRKALWGVAAASAILFPLSVLVGFDGAFVGAALAGRYLCALGSDHVHACLYRVVVVSAAFEPPGKRAEGDGSAVVHSLYHSSNGHRRGCVSPALGAALPAGKVRGSRAAHGPGMFSACGGAAGHPRSEEDPVSQQKRLVALLAISLSHCEMNAHVAHGKSSDGFRCRGIGLYPLKKEGKAALLNSRFGPR
ncbi:hypothetical protein EI42_01216 [Thermosporothrix hazakensis]|uniref:Uncharacterized protein n=1 Tax=Thermosporothrix hazakensis TaxID=644383 RepID=A0A326UCP0_THEHA|nr:hypothetical protein [Thermosporothrix hazakensis]PZW34379.1 hypothetical protein EI42_01216 [Thermosporothrix hazakensis]